MPHNDETLGHEYIKILISIITIDYINNPNL